MKHPEYKYLMRYVDKECTASEEKAISEHILKCKDCRDKIEEIKELRALIKKEIEYGLYTVGDEIIPREIKEKIVNDTLESIKKEPSFLEKVSFIITESFYFKPYKALALLFTIIIVVLAVVILTFAGIKSKRLNNYSRVVTSTKINSEVLQLQFINSTGVLFQIEDSEGNITAVIWINDYDDKEGGS